jgi:hypothetical protein
LFDSWEKGHELEKDGADGSGPTQSALSNQAPCAAVAAAPCTIRIQVLGHIIMAQLTNVA